MRTEIEAAGFVLDAQSTFLANKEDPHVAKAFVPSIKGKTDRCVYRFEGLTGVVASSRLTAARG